MSSESSERSVRRKPVLEYPCADPPAGGEVKEIAPGVLWIRMPLPFALNHINLWAVRDGDGWAIFDTGVQNPDTVSAWRTLLAGASGEGPRTISRVFVTHMHPDHVGMAGWLTRKYDCRLWMTRLEYLNCRVLVADTGRAAPDDGIRFYRRAGWDEDAIEYYRTRFGNFGKATYALPESYRRVIDGEVIRIGDHDWTVIVGSGHSPEHACFHCPDLGLLISGDQVLPKISSNVSVFPTEPDANPLDDWLVSIDKIKAAVPQGALVLPAHGEPFRGLAPRLDDLARGHHISLDRLRRSIGKPVRAIDVFGALFARGINDRHLLSLATGESVAHLNYLVHRGEACAVPDGDGVVWYQSTQSDQPSP